MLPDFAAWRSGAIYARNKTDDYDRWIGGMTYAPAIDGLPKPPKRPYGGRIGAGIICLGIYAQSLEDDFPLDFWDFYPSLSNPPKKLQFRYNCH